MKNLFDGGYYMIRALMLVAMLFCLGATLGAATIDCTTAAPPLNFSASFTNTGIAAGAETETIVLTNTATCFAQDPTQVLTGLGFNYSGPTLTPVSATASELVDVSTGTQTNPSANANVGGGWQYLTGISFQGDNAGISSTGLNIFGPGGNFTPTATNNCGNTMLDGLACGILPTGDGTTGLAADAAGGITGHGPLAYNQVTFTLTYTCPMGGCASAPTFSNVFGQYGTSTSDFHTAIPEPTSILLLGTGLAFIGKFLKRRLAA
jgi:hypothetical protein